MPEFNPTLNTGPGLFGGESAPQPPPKIEMPSRANGHGRYGALQRATHGTEAPAQRATLAHGRNTTAPRAKAPEAAPPVHSISVGDRVYMAPPPGTVEPETTGRVPTEHAPHGGRPPRNTARPEIGYAADPRTPAERAIERNVDVDTSGPVDYHGGGFDAYAAAKHAISHARGDSSGWCRKFVKEAVRAGGVSIEGAGTGVSPERMRELDPKILRRAGFEPMPPGTKPEIGDIARTARGGSENLGHWTMYVGEHEDGRAWVSDFAQHNANPYANSSETPVLWRHKQVIPATEPQVAMLKRQSFGRRGEVQVADARRPAHHAPKPPKKRLKAYHGGPPGRNRGRNGTKVAGAGPGLG